MSVFHPALLLAAVSLAHMNVAASAPSGPTVHIHNFAFVPASLTVPAGATVTFVNDDDEPHTATATTKAFDSEAIDTHGTWTHRFDKTGTYPYFCELHPMMHGTLVVTKAKT
jgi:plastocyanin